MNCEKSDCENDATGVYEVSGPPAGTFDVALCGECAPNEMPTRQLTPETEAA